MEQLDFKIFYQYWIIIIHKTKGIVFQVPSYIVLWCVSIATSNSHKQVLFFDYYGLVYGSNLPWKYVVSIAYSVVSDSKFTQSEYYAYTCADILILSRVWLASICNLLPVDRLIIHISWEKECDDNYSIHYWEFLFVRALNSFDITIPYNALSFI